LLLELEELFDELLDEPFEELLEELLLLEFDDRLLLELLELLDDRLLLLLADEFEDEFDDELAELLPLELDERLEELFEAPCPPRPPPLRGPLMSERLLLALDELSDDELFDRLLDDPFCRPPRSSASPTAAAADFMPRSQPLKKRCTGVSPRGLELR
jgi:AcrR family transcriptional regulator